MRDDTPHDDNGTPERPPLIAVVVTLGAAALAIVHLLQPDWKVDGITVALVVVALLPWLGPLFKSIELPGLGRVEFQEYKRHVEAKLAEQDHQVQTLGERVEQVERLAFAPDVAPNLRDSLESVVSRFHDRMTDIGLGDIGPVPSVRVTDSDDSNDNAYYDIGRREIVLGTHLADDPEVTLREYTHHLLVAGREAYETMAFEAQALESGLADYFPCSFTGDPALGRRVANIFHRPWIRNLANDRHRASADATIPQDAGEVWGAALWSVRSLVGPDQADRSVLAAWRVASQNGWDGAETRFIASVCATLPDVAVDVERIFTTRGLPPKG
jgi:hypothetical protein